jgi:cytochrome c oxidase subunit 2
MGPGEDTAGGQNRQRGRVKVAPLVLLSVVASALGVGLGLLIDWFPTAASTQADPIDTLWDVLIVVSVPIFVLVVAVTLYCVYAFKMRPGEELQDGPPIHGNTKLEVVWTAIPAILILGLCVYAYTVLDDIEEAQAGETQVNVVGQQFTWTFEYPRAGGDPVRANRLYLVKGQPVKFNVRSEDVIHDFWVPAFRMKIDAVPGITTKVRATPTKVGSFPIVCAELCGIGHAYMRQTATVLEKADYDAKLRELAEGPPASGGEGGGEGEGSSAGGAGKGVFTAQGCGGCHALADAGSSGTTGPNLDDVLANMDADKIREAIVDPNAEVAEGFGPNIMPGNYEDTIPADQLDALVAYLEEQSR